MPTFSSTAGVSAGRPAAPPAAGRLDREQPARSLALLGLRRLERGDQVCQLLLLRLEVDNLLGPLGILLLLERLAVQQPLARVLEVAYGLLEPGDLALELLNRLGELALDLERLGELPPAKVNRVLKDGSVRVNGHARLRMHASQQRATCERHARDGSDQL